MMVIRQGIIKRALKVLPEVPPAENFREIEIIRTVGDIRNPVIPYLRKNKAKGKFDDGQHYLDVHFRLLREDLVQPLREGVHELINEVSKCEKTQSLRLYHKIKMKYPQCTNNGMIYRISFDAAHTKGILWKHSRKLIYGSLLCFSIDQFETMVFATVANRAPESLSKGLLDTRLVSFEDLKYFQTCQEMLMVESKTYFEP